MYHYPDDFSQAAVQREKNNKILNSEKVLQTREKIYQKFNAAKERRAPIFRFSLSTLPHEARILILNELEALFPKELYVREAYRHTIDLRGEKHIGELLGKNSDVNYYIKSYQVIECYQIHKYADEGCDKTEHEFLINLQPAAMALEDYYWPTCVKFGDEND